MLKTKKRFSSEFFHFLSSDGEYECTVFLQVLKALDYHRKNGKMICRVIAKFNSERDAKIFSEELNYLDKQNKQKGKFVHFRLPKENYLL